MRREPRSKGRSRPTVRHCSRDMQRLGMVLDVTHLSDQSMVEALNRFEGHLWASHHNCRALVPWQRQLTDEQIRRWSSATP